MTIKVFTYSDDKIVELEQEGEHCGFWAGDLVEGFFFDLKRKRAVIVGFSCDAGAYQIWAVYKPVLYHPKLKMFIAIPFSCFKAQRHLEIIEHSEHPDLARDSLREALSKFLEKPRQRYY